MEKIRLNIEIMESILSRFQRYDAPFSKEVICTPIILKTPCWNGAYQMYQRRICFKIGNFKYYGRFKGKAPIEKPFTIDQFMDHFYAIKDDITGMYVFKYYNKK